VLAGKTQPLPAKLIKKTAKEHSYSKSPRHISGRRIEKFILFEYY